MEDRRPLTSETDDETDAPVSKRRGRAAEFFAAYLARKESDQGERAIDEDDDDAETLTPAERRWKKLFGPLKGLLQRSEPRPANDNAEQAQAVRAASETATVATAETKVASESAEAEEPEVPVERPAPPEGRAEFISTPESTPATPTVEAVPTASAELTPPPRRPDAFIATPDSVFIVPRTETAPSYAAAAATSETTPPPANYERTIIERGGPATALVGLEYLARRRAIKKVETRASANTAKQIKPLRAAAEQQQAVNQRTETVTERQGTEIKTTTERVQRLEQAAVIPIPYARERAPQPSITPETPLVGPAEAPKVTNDRLPSQSTTPERAIPGVETQRPSKAAAIENEPSNQLQPEKIFEKVARAAEINAPIERSYELRQEVRDDPGFAAATAGATRRSSADTALRQTATSLNDSLRRTEKINQSLVNQLRNMPPQYRQATASGFVAAVALLAVIFIISAL